MTYVVLKILLENTTIALKANPVQKFQLLLNYTLLHISSPKKSLMLSSSRFLYQLNELINSKLAHYGIFILFSNKIK